MATRTVPSCRSPSSILMAAGPRSPEPRTPTAAAPNSGPRPIEALREALKVRKQPTDPKYAGRVFITKYGQPFRACALGFEFEKLAVKIGMTREEADFYDLRRTCCQHRHPVQRRRRRANDHGAQAGLGRHARRLQPAPGERRAADGLSSDHIHDWLFPAKVKAKGKAKTRAKKGRFGTGIRRRPAGRPFGAGCVTARCWVKASRSAGLTPILWSSVFFLGYVVSA